MAEPLPAFLWERDALVEHYGARRYLYGRWDQLFGCWVTDRDQRPRSLYPSWPLVDASGRLCLGYSSASCLGTDVDDVDDECPDAGPFWRDGVQAPADLAALDLRCTAETLFQRYVDLIPCPIRTVVGRFGEWQWLILSMIWREQAVADFLRAELDGIGPGFVAACLAMNGAERLTSAERSGLCRRIMFDKRETLIPGVGETCSPRSAVAVFGKLQPDAWRARTCRDLLAILSDRSKARIISRDHALTPGTIEVLRRLPGWICTGNLPRLLDGLEDVADVERGLVALVERVEGDAGDLRDAVVRSLRHVRTGDQLVSKIEDWNTRIGEMRGVPAPPFPSAGPLRALSSAGMIRAEALRMQNCIVHYLPEVIAGRVYFYHWDAAEQACVMLTRTRSRGWRMSDCLGIRNESLAASTVARIRASVRAGFPPTRRRRRSSLCSAQLTLPL